MTSKYIALKNVFLQKSIFVDIFFSCNPNRVMGVNGGYFPAICRVCFVFLLPSLNKDRCNVFLFNYKLICFFLFLFDAISTF